ncbi:MAG: thioredoxin family protein [Bryobacteraceae bacterium]|jgi:thioredoxin-related protein
MVRTAMFRLAIGLLASFLLLAEETPPPASVVMESARTAASAQHKSIFLVFHASWCGYCRKLDQFIETAEIKPIIDKYFVQARLTVQEQGAKKPLNNPGGDEVMAGAGGKDAGLPFFAFLNEAGETIVNSIWPGEGKAAGRNIGHPVQPQEVDWFPVMVKKAAPAMSPDEARILENWLRAQKK